MILTATCLPCVPLSAYTADLHSHLSPMCTFVSIHCWLPDHHSHWSALCEAGLQVACCLPYLCKYTLLVTWSSQLLVSLAWDWHSYCLPYLCKHILLVTMASQSFVSLVWNWLDPVAFFTVASIHCYDGPTVIYVPCVGLAHPCCFLYLCKHTLLVMMAPQSFMYHV